MFAVRSLSWPWALCVLSLTGALLAAVLLGGLWLRQEQLLFHPAPLPADYPLARQPDVAERFFPVQGAVLSALHLQRPGARGVVLFLHGNAGNLADWFGDTTLYRQAGFDLLMLDYRGYGKSTGHIGSEAQLRADVRAVWTALAPQYAGRRVVVLGQSIGTALAAGLALEMAQGQAPGPAPDLTVLVSPYRSMAALAAQWYPWVPSVLLRYPLRTEESVARLRSPLLLVHGQADAVIAPSHSEALFALAPQARLLRIPGAGHNDLYRFPAYQEALAAALSAL